MVTLFKDLMRRRVPHIVGVYFAAGWAVLEFTDWLVNRYLLSPHLTDVALAAWALMIPTVLLLAYFHGAPGRDHWTRVEKIGIPLNVLVAVGLLAALFAGKELGATTRSVTLENEAGVKIERQIPKREFRKSLAIFYFDNTTADTALDWLQFAIPYALEFDLSQDYFLDRRFGPDFAERLREQGYPEGTDLPLTLKRDVAERLHMQHFVSGQVTRQAGAPAVEVGLYDTERGKLLAEHTFPAADPLTLADTLSLQLKRDLDIPEQHIEEAEDLPVAAMLTASPEAFRSFMRGFQAAYVDNDWQRGVREWESAAAMDPHFAAAQWELWSGYTLINETDKGARALENVMGQLYRLPEQLQVAAKVQYYWLVKQDIDKAQAAASMLTELTPEDPSAHIGLARLYETRDDRRRAIAAYDRALALDSGRYEVLLKIGRLYSRAAEFDSALAYYQRYIEKAPRDPLGPTIAAEIYQLLGEPAKAREQFQRALVIENDDVPALIGLADLEMDHGNFEAALAGYNDARAAAATPEQRAQVFQALKTYYVRRGRPNAATEYVEQRWHELESGFPPFIALQEKLEDLDTYVMAGRAGQALDSLRAIRARFDPPFDLIVPFGAAIVYLEMEDPDSLELALRGVEKLIQGLGLENLRPFALYAEGRVFEWRGACDQAIVNYRRALESNPESVGFYLELGRCYRKLGDLDRAEQELLNYLRIRPYYPEARVELARVYEARGRHAEAISQLRTALEVWSEAEPEYKPAQEALQMMGTMQNR